MFKFGSIKEIFLILGGVIIFLFVFYIILVLTSENKKHTSTINPSLPSNKCYSENECSVNKLCSNGECKCFPWFTGDCDEPIFSLEALKNFMTQLNGENVSEESVNTIFVELNKHVPGNYKNKEDLKTIISSLQVLSDTNIDKSKKLDSIETINNIIKKDCEKDGNKCRSDQICKDGRCICSDTNTTECTGKCVNLKNDSQNCGYCNKSVPENTVCVNGVPVGNSGYKFCGTWGPKSLNPRRNIGRVIDINNDPQNCGDCNKICPNGQICTEGKCQCPIGSVWYSADGTNYTCVDNSNNNFIEFDGKYYDTTNDKEKCGKEGIKCISDQICKDGLCICPENSVLFNGTCVNNNNSQYQKCGTDTVDIFTNEDHCGSCENKCYNTQDCVDGNCQCPIGSVWYSADGANYTCVDNSNNNFIEFDGKYYDTLTSSERCGSTGVRCRSSDQICKDGLCICSDTNTTECNDACINYKNDPKNCGDCNKPAPENTVCVDGVPVGNSGYKYCGDWKSNTGKVINLKNDSQNCGDCNKICPNGQICTEGKCQCPIGSVWYSSGNENYTCVDNSKNNFIEINGKYYDTSNDTLNCGTSGNKCRGDQICKDGLCICRDTNTTECNGACINTKNDSKNCGACNNICPDIQTCTDGKCLCPIGTVWYRSSGEDHKCVDNSSGRYKEFDGIYYDTLTSSERCGSEGDRCRSDDQRCVDGNCVCSDTNKTDCKGECINFNIDNNNCGGCENKVPVNTTCQDGKPIGKDKFVYCPKEPWPSSNYTVSDTSNDTSNCGECGKTCGENELCSEKKCYCPDGFTICDGKCVKIDTNDRCGSCSNKCTNGMVCKTIKEQGKGKSGNTYIISETKCSCPDGNDLNSDSNCGTCGNVCKSDQICVGGKCICRDGRYMSDGSQCMLCPPGKFCKDGTVKNCPPGTYSKEGASSCTQCDEGTYSGEGASSCTTCGTGSYSDSKGASSCTICPSGSFSFNSIGCLTCSEGSYCKDGIETKCPAGTYSNSKSSSCTPCPAGSYSAEGSKECTRCEIGTFSNSTGTKRCTTCPPGSYSDSKGATICKMCDHTGSICINGIKSPCPPGTYQINNTCEKCPKGSVNPNPGSAKCSPCQEGVYADEEGLTECKKCPAGTFNNQSIPPSHGEFGGNFKNVCQPAVLGSYSDVDGLGNWKHCPVGTYADVKGLKECKSCPPGLTTYSNGRQRASECGLPEGTKCDRNSSCASKCCGKNSVFDWNDTCVVGTNNKAPSGYGCIGG